MLKFKIRHQQISRVDSFRPVEKSINYLHAEFDFLTSDWNGFDKKAVCKNISSGISYDAPIVGDRCLIPWEAIDKYGKFEIAVHGSRGNVKLPTGVCTVDLGRTLDDGTASIPPTPTEFDLLKERVDKLEQTGGGGSGGGSGGAVEVRTDYSMRI